MDSVYRLAPLGASRNGKRHSNSASAIAMDWSSQHSRTVRSLRFPQENAISVFGSNTISSLATTISRVLVNRFEHRTASPRIRQFRHHWLCYRIVGVAADRHPGQVDYSHNPPQEGRDEDFSLRADQARKVKARLRRLHHAKRLSGNVSQICRFFEVSRAL